MSDKELELLVECSHTKDNWDEYYLCMVCNCPNAIATRAILHERARILREARTITFDAPPLHEVLHFNKLEKICKGGGG